MAVIIQPAASADMPIGLETRFEVWGPGRIFTLGGFGHTAQRCSRIEATTSVCTGRNVMELPDSNAPFTGQHCGGELFDECLSHARKIIGNWCQNY